jgi:hypothetical protein
MIEDPEFKAEFLQPLKLQGVADILENALVMRFKFTVRPNVPTSIQREAIKRFFRPFKAPASTLPMRPSLCRPSIRRSTQPRPPRRQARRGSAGSGRYLDRQPACSGLTTGVQITRSICGAPAASMTSRSNPKAMPDASGITARADKKSSSIG